jgi:hypothetical protein
MAITKTIEIGVDSSSAEKDVNKLISRFEELGKDATKSMNNIEKGVENTEKATKSLANGFKGVGVAIKAMGIGLVLEAFNILKDLFMSNQVIADKFGAVFKALSIAFNDFFNYINKNADGVVKFFKNIFENPVESLKKFGDLIKENIIERFNSALEVAGFMADALKKLFTGDFQGALKSVKEAGKEMVDVFTGVDDTTGKVGKLVDKTIDYAKATFSAAEALQKQENNAKRAVAIQAGLVEEYDRQAETLRQIRDDDSRSIDERIKANNDLKDVLENQRKAMLAQANLQVQAAANQYNLNKSIENEVALIEARNNVKGVEAQITGLVSEQKANENALSKEAIELAKSRNETETELAINQKLFEAERLKDEEKKLIAQKEAIENQRNLDLERLQSNIELYKQGTQARIDAENEYALRKQELDNSIIAKEDEIAQYRLEKEKERIAKEGELEQQRVAQKQAALDAILGLVNAETAVGRAALIAKQILGAKEMIMEARKTLTFSSMAAAKSAAAVAEGTAQTAKVGFPQNIPLLVSYAAQAIGIFSAIRQAVSKSKSAAAMAGVGGSGGSVGNAPSVGGGGGTAPQFNVVGNSGVNQIAQTLGSQQPVQAYVVANNVTTAQALDRNIIQNASMG